MKNDTSRFARNEKPIRGGMASGFYFYSPRQVNRECSNRLRFNVTGPCRRKLYVGTRTPPPPPPVSANGRGAAKTGRNGSHRFATASGPKRETSQHRANVRTVETRRLKGKARTRAALQFVARAGTGLTRRRRAAAQKRFSTLAGPIGVIAPARILARPSGGEQPRPKYYYYHCCCNNTRVEASRQLGTSCCTTPCARVRRYVMPQNFIIITQQYSTRAYTQ